MIRMVSPDIEQALRVMTADLKDFADITLPNQADGAINIGVKYQKGVGSILTGVTLTFGEHEVALDMKKWRPIMAERLQHADAYSDAVKNHLPTKIEEIDSAKRLHHNDSANQLLDDIESAIPNIDFGDDNPKGANETARMLFDLITAVGDPLIRKGQQTLNTVVKRYWPIERCTLFEQRRGKRPCVWRSRLRYLARA
jgi:uncharacterized protein (UPF0262 family)